LDEWRLVDAELDGGVELDPQSGVEVVGVELVSGPYLAGTWAGGWRAAMTGGASSGRGTRRGPRLGPSRSRGVQRAE